MKNKKQKQGNPPGSFFGNTRLQAVVLGLLVFILYSRTVSFEYIGFDDTTMIVDNYRFIRNFENIPRAFTEHVFYFENNIDKDKEYYRPMMTLSFMLDAHIAGSYMPRWYHFANVVYHFAACLLLLFFLRKIKAGHAAAFVLTLIFAVHPVVTQAVAWIPGRNDMLLAIFMFSSFIFFMEYLETKRRRPLMLHLIFFAFALFSKENGVMFPVLCFFYMQFIHREKLLSRSGMLLSAGYILFIVPWIFLRQHALEGSSVENSFHSAIANIIKNAPFLLQYVGKAVLPFNLSVMFTIEDANYIFPLLALGLIILGIVLSAAKRWSYMIFGLSWFLLFLVPSFSARLVEGLEHRLYVPVAGFFILASETDWMKALSSAKAKLFTVPVLTFAVFLFITGSRIDIFRNRFSFYLSAIETSEHAIVPCINLAADYEQIGKPEKAMEMYRIALGRDSTYRMLRNNIGGMYLHRQMFREAEHEFLAELRHHPENVYANYNLGLVYLNTGRVDEAAVMWKKVLALQSDFVNAYQRLMQYYQGRGDTISYNHYAEAYRRFAKSSQ